MPQTKACSVETRPVFLTFLILGLCALWPLHLTNADSSFARAVREPNAIAVKNEDELQAALSLAHRLGGNTVIDFVAGTYTIGETLHIRAPGIKFQGNPEDPHSVIIEGTAMSADAEVANIITVHEKHFVLDGITLRYARNHLIQIKGEHGADYVTIKNCILRDAFQQLLKITAGRGPQKDPSDNGLIENCLFEYSAGIGPQYYIGGVDAHGARHWIVRKNVFRNIISPRERAAQYAIHFWNNSSDNIVEQNLIVNCDRGIGFGMGTRGNVNGIIRNNMIYHAREKGQFADVGIAIHNSPGTLIINNSIYQQHSYPNSIEYRFYGTSNVTIANNLVNRKIRSLDRAAATVRANKTNANAEHFKNTANGDLHLRNRDPSIIDQGYSTSFVLTDFDDDSRPHGAGFDIGADEYID